MLATARARRRRRRRAASSTPSLPGTTRSSSETWRLRSSGSAPQSRAGTRICVHGDYDVDGICATALAVLVPPRARRGRRLAPAEQVRGGLRRLARHARPARGRRRRARSSPSTAGSRPSRRSPRRRRRGLEVVVTDHHRPGEVLPDCPIVATRPSSYPFPELCGTGVVYKLGEALLGADHPAVRRNLDLVALATIADVVPLVDENRALAAAGLRALAATRPTGAAGAHAERRRRSRGRRLGRRRLQARAAHQRRRPARPARRRARARAHRRCRRGAAARRRARGAEPRPPGRGGSDPARGDRCRRRDARAPQAVAAATCSGTRTGTRA